MLEETTGMEANTTIQDILAEMQVKFKELRKLLDDHEKFSTKSEPYKIKYQAIEVLKTMETDLTNILTVMPEEQKGEEVIMLALVHLNLGLLHANTEELKPGEEQFMKCINLLKNKELEPEAILTVLGALNQLGIIWSQWNQPVKAKSFLDQAEQIYNDVKNTNHECRNPIHITQNFGIKEVKNELTPEEILEKIHTVTLYYLAQTYSSLKDHHKSAIYCHMTLRRQLCNIDTPDFDYIQWALNAETLSYYFMENEAFSQARHHLAAASYILQKYENILKKKTENDKDSEVVAAEWEEFKHRGADIAKCWAKYGILLLRLSKQRLLEKSETEQKYTQSDNKDSSKLKMIADLKFDILEKDIEPILNQITDDYLLTFEDARLVLLNAQKWLEQAKTYYTLGTHTSDHILIVQDISQAYKYLSFFEKEESRQAEIHKRRINILENVIKVVNPQHYRKACRPVWTELGETYSLVLSIKLDQINASGTCMTSQIVTEVNHLARIAIKYFRTFLDTLEIHHSDCGIDPFPDDVLKPALFSYIHIGRLHTKIKTVDKRILLKNTENSYHAYKFVVDYCKKYPNAAEIIKTELNICKEIVDLLPMKIGWLQRKS